MCLDYPDFIEHVQAITGSGKDELNESLDTFVGEIINAKVQINPMDKEIKVPRVFESYLSDFGRDNKAVLEFIFRYLEEPELDFDQCVEEVVVKRNIYILYE